MPIYNFKNIRSKKIKTIEMSMAEREEYILNHPNEIQVFIKPLHYSDSMMLGHLNKEGQEFQKHVLGRMAESIPHNNIKQQMRRFKQSKEI